MTRAYRQTEVPTAEDLSKVNAAAVSIPGVRIVGVTPFADAGTNATCLGYVVCLVARDEDVALELDAAIDQALHGADLHQDELPL